MSNIKINQLPDASLPLDGTEELPIDQGGTTVKATIDDVVSKVQENTVVNGLDSPKIIADEFANRPSSEVLGTLFVSSNPFGLYRYNGASWDSLTISTTPTFQDVITAGNTLTDGVNFQTLLNDSVARIKNDNLTQDRNYQLPDAAGTLALQSSVGVQSVTGSTGISVNNTNPSAPIISITSPTENNTNKSQNVTTDGSSAVKYPSVVAIKDYVDAVAAGLLKDRGNYDASSNVFPSTGGSGVGGAIQVGDLWYISVAGTLGGNIVEVGYSIRAGVNNPGQTSANWFRLNVGLGFVPENVANKSVDGTFTANSDTLYPSQKAVKTYVDNKPTPTLQEVLNVPDLIVGKNFQGTGAGADVSEGASEIVGLGTGAAANSEGSNVIAIGAGAGVGNTFDNVALLGEGATADEANQLVFTNGAGANARISINSLSADRKYTLPNASGTLALAGDTGWGLTGNEGTTPGTNFIGTTDATNFIIKTNNAAVMTFASNGGISAGGSLIIANDPTTNPRRIRVASSSTPNNKAEIGMNATDYGYLLLGNGTNIGTVKAGADLTANRIYTFPDADGTLAIQAYKVYTAIVTNSFSSGFSVNVLQNTIGTGLSWSDAGNGLFLLSSTTPVFTTNKTWLIASITGASIFYNFVTQGTTTIRLQPINNSGQSVAYFSTNIEIRVYP